MKNWVHNRTRGSRKTNQKNLELHSRVLSNKTKLELGLKVLFNSKNSTNTVNNPTNKNNKLSVLKNLNP